MRTGDKNRQFALTCLGVFSAVILAVSLILPSATYAAGNSSGTSSPTPTPTPAHIKGDLNGDGRVDCLDLILLQIMLNNGTLPVAKCSGGDINCDGKITTADRDSFIDIILGRVHPQGGGGGGGGGSATAPPTNTVHFNSSSYATTYGPGSTGQNFTARVQIDSTNYLYNGTFTVNYNSSLLQVNNVSDGNFSGKDIPMVNGSNWSNSAGVLTVSPDLSAYVNMSSNSSDGISGSGYLCDIQFQTIAAGDSPLAINGTLNQRKTGNFSAISGMKWTNSSVVITQWYNLSVSATAHGNVTAPGVGIFPYANNSIVTITAAPTDSCWQFYRWEGNTSTIANVSAASSTIKVNGSYAITANFSIKTFNLSVTANNSGGSPTGSGSYNCSSNATISANTSPGYTFVYWSGAGVENTSTETTNVSMTQARNVTAYYTITPANLTSIAVTPTSASINIGDTQQFVANGSYDDGSHHIITSSVTWNSSNTSAATINSSTGLATGVAAGTANITASLSGITSNNATLTVNATTLDSIAVTPTSASLTKDETQQFVANGSYSNGSYRIITSSVTWNSSNTSAATINSSTGLATGVAAGTANITASLSGITSNNATLTVSNATLNSIAVTPAPASIAIDATQQFVANGSYDDGSYRIITSSVTWNSSNTSAATINSSGVATGVAVGTANITAALSGITSNNASLTVTPPIPNGITNLAIVPATQGGIQYNAIRLNWSAPSNVAVDSYIVKWNTSAITNANWNTSYNCTANDTVIFAPGLKAPGALQNCTVTNLSENTTYYFAVKSINGSQISNISTPSTTNATALQPDLDVGEWWLWNIRADTSSGSYTDKNFCYQIDFVDAVNQTVTTHAANSSNTSIVVPNTARIESNMDTNPSNNANWGRGRARVIGAPTVGQVENMLWDMVAWAKSNDPTLPVVQSSLADVLANPYGLGLGISSSNGYYTYNVSGTAPGAPRPTDGYPFALGDPVWRQNVFQDAFTNGFGEQKVYYGNDYKVVGSNASYNVGAITTDPDGNSSAYSTSLYAPNSSYFTWYLTNNRSWASDSSLTTTAITQWWYSPQAHTAVRHIDNTSYKGWEDWLLLGCEVRDFGKSNLVVTGYTTSWVNVSMTVTNNCSDSTQNYSVLCCLLNMSAQTRSSNGNNQLFKNGECVYPNIHSPTSTTWPEYDAIKFTGDLAPGASKVMTWNISYSTPSSYTWAVWCSGLTNMSTGSYP